MNKETPTDTGESLRCDGEYNFGTGWPAVSRIRYLGWAGPGLWILLLFSGAAFAQNQNIIDVEYERFYEAVNSGDTEGALSAGRLLYTRLAIAADGRGPFARTGMLLAASETASHQVTAAISKIRATESGATTFGVPKQLASRLR